MKKTSPSQNGVKTTSKRTLFLESDLVTRMKPRRRILRDSPVRLVRPDARNSPFKKIAFDSLLDCWRNNSNTVLTQPQFTIPKLDKPTDSQSEEPLEINKIRRISKTAIIGQKIGKPGSSATLDQSGGASENRKNLYKK